MKRQENRIAFQGGAYSLAITAVVLAILVVINVLAASLPSSLMKYDISSSKLYSITSNTKVVVNALDQDVNGSHGAGTHTGVAHDPIVSGSGPSA